MWIEVIGLPGVGKTTMAEKSLSSIEENYKIIRSNAPSLLERIAAKLLLHTVYARKVHDQKLAAKLAYRHGFRLFQNRSSNIFFYDSGIMQLILENLIETDFADQQQKLDVLSGMPLPDKIIYIDDDLDVIAERETERAEPRFKMDYAQTAKSYKTAKHLIESALLPYAGAAETVRSGNTEEFLKALTIKT